MPNVWELNTEVFYLWAVLTHMQYVVYNNSEAPTEQQNIWIYFPLVKTLRAIFYALNIIQQKEGCHTNLDPEPGIYVSVKP